MRSATRWQDKLTCMLGLAKSMKSTPYANVYAEPVYRDLICREVRRSNRSGHSCRILLIYQADTQGRIIPFVRELSDATISVLSGNCRDTDYIGWYRESRILGVVLTALRSGSARDACDRVMVRLMDGLRGVMYKNDHCLQMYVLERSEPTTQSVAEHPVPFSDSIDPLL